MFGFELTDYDRKVYNEELKDFLPNTIVDSHAHCWRVEDDEYDRSKFPKKWTNLVAKDCYVEDLIKTYHDLFEGKKVIPVVFGNSIVKCMEHNAYVEQVKKKHGFPALFWTRYQMSKEFVKENVIKGGYDGLKPYLGGCKDGVNPAEADVYDFLPPEHLEVANELKLKVILHLSKSDRFKNKSNLDTLLEIEEKYPNVKLIVAHIGRAYTKSDVGDAFERLKNTKNMLFDFSANTNSDVIREAIETFGTKRILFGTDLPIAKMRMYRTEENGVYVNVVPRGLYGDVSKDVHMRESDEKEITNFVYEILRAFKKAATELNLTRKDVFDIMCGNASKLYDIKF
jgi:Tat protein secretion system quality control protein TatD with DNase activity